MVIKARGFLLSGSVRYGDDVPTTRCSMASQCHSSAGSETCRLDAADTQLSIGSRVTRYLAGVRSNWYVCSLSGVKSLLLLFETN